MTKRGDSPARRDRLNEPFSRLPDAVYTKFLPHVTPYEVTLWLALKCQAWRKDGSKKGVIRKSLRRISRDIGMPWKTTWGAFEGLKAKGFARRDAYGIRLLDPDFTTAVTTAITTTEVKGGQRKQSESGSTRTSGGSTRTRKWFHQNQGGHLVPFPVNSLDHGREDLKETARDPSRGARDRGSKNSSASVPTVTAPPSVRDSGGRTARKAHRKETNVQKPNDSDELRVRDLPADEARALLQRVRARALKNADAGLSKLEEQKRKRYEREDARRAELRAQLEALEGES